MKLQATTYVSPLSIQGTYSNVEIEDVSIIHNRKDKKLTLVFEVTHLKNSKRISLGKIEMLFAGANGDAVTTNQTMYMSYTQDGVTYDNIPFLSYLTEHNGVLPEDYTITEFGYPNYEDVLNYFDGGTFDEPEIIISNPLAIGFVMEKLRYNNEPVGLQFQIV